MRIGILGGTFNPIHIGHLILAENTITELNLDKVIFMPSGVSYLKDQNTIVSAEHRINMVKLAIAGNNHFELSTMETEREGDTYTYETLNTLKSQNTQDELYFIGGADTLMNIDSWKRPDLIFKACTLVIAPRDFIERNTLEERSLFLKEKYNAKIIILNSSNIDISSSDIRNRIKTNKSAKYYLPDNVIEYILTNSLYED